MLMQVKYKGVIYMKKFICILLVFITAVSVLIQPDLMRIDLHAEDNTSSENLPSVTTGVPEGSYSYAFPDNMKATVITIGYDFFKDINQTADVTQAEIDEIFADLESYGLNSVIINTSYNGVIYYEVDTKIYQNGSPLDMVIEAARSRNFYVYISYNLNDAINSKNIEELNSKIDYLSLCAHKLTNKYMIDGIILDGYYASKDEQSYSDYINNGSGIGFESWLRDNSSYVFKLVSSAIHSTNNTIAVGIAINNAWLNESTDELGSDTEDDFEALANGYSDTKAYIENGYADFMVVTCYGGLESVELNFISIVSWWDKLASQVGIPMFISHANERISNSDSSWAADQILKQLEECRNYSSYRGSVFRSYESLKENTGTSTDALKKYFDGLIDTNSLYTELSMVLPKQYNYTTYEPTVKFQGSFDSNFDIYFNGEKIELNEAGNFYFEEDLDVGLNTFTFKNKAKTVTYKITRRVKVLQSCEPEEGTELRVEGTTRISVNVIAYSGSEVTATLNGETISLTEGETAPDELDSNTNYAMFSGYFVAPEGIVGEEQDLGNIVINGNYMDICYETMNSARVIINAVSPQAERAQLIVVKEDNTQTYDYYTTDNVATPDCVRLPAGTIDVLVNEVTYNVSYEGVSQSVKYYLTGSGLRIRAADCELIDGYTIVDNTAVLTGSYVSNTDTILTFSLGYQTPFDISFSPEPYSGSGGDSYSVSNFDPDYLCITFDYLSNANGMTQFTSDSLFSSGEWRYVDVDGEQKLQLRLRLRKSGIFAGYSASYDGTGNLTIRFNGYRSSIYGAVIVIDPGHGYNKSASVFDPGAVAHVLEQSINIAIAEKLTQTLQAAGATVYMLPTDTTYINLYDRSSYAAQYDPDVFISVHCNSVAKGEGIRGVEAYYFTPFSQPLAALVSKSMADYYEEYVYGDGVNRNRGAKYNYFAVTLEQQFPSILIESGFITDYEEAMALNDPSVQQGLASAITEAVIEYFAENR